MLWLEIVKKFCNGPWSLDAEGAEQLRQQKLQLLHNFRILLRTWSRHIDSEIEINSRQLTLRALSSLNNNYIVRKNTSQLCGYIFCVGEGLAMGSLIRLYTFLHFTFFLFVCLFYFDFNFHTKAKFYRTSEK